MTEAELFGKQYPCKEADVYGYGSLKVGAMRFRIQRYEIAGAGNLSVMNGTAMLGLMKMKTVIFTPLAKDAPLFSYDRINAMGNDTLIIELYNTVLSEKNDAYINFRADFDRLKDSFKSIPEHDLGAHWYDSLKLPSSLSKKGKKKTQKESFDAIYRAYLEKYLKWLASSPSCDTEIKAAEDERYVSGLIQNGGASTDAFVKAIGKEKTAGLFRKVLFGTAITLKKNS